MKKILMSLIVVSFIFTLNFNVNAKKMETIDDNEQIQNIIEAGEASNNKHNKNDGKDGLVENINNNTTDGQYNNYKGVDVVCGKGVHFSPTIVNISYYVILVFQVAAPIVIVIFGMFDLVKSVMSGKDDEIKKGQATFLKRLIAGVMLFLVITITKVMLNIFAGDGIVECVNCFLNGANSCR